jgi:rieske iron-sulfur protein
MSETNLIVDTVELSRRSVLVGASALIVAGKSSKALGDDARAEKLKPGDRIVFASGEHQGQPARLDLLIPGSPPVAALPADPGTGTVRDGSRFNKLLLLRLTPDALDEETRPHSVEGVVAYSAVCTHQGCTLNAWNAEAQVIQCFCHHSEFSAAAAGRPTKGPATASLPLLPLAVADGALIVAGDFTSKPGPRK